jgi:hypothetical protein
MVAIRVVVTAHKDDNNESVGMLPNNARVSMTLTMLPYLRRYSSDTTTVRRKVNLRSRKSMLRRSLCMPLAHLCPERLSHKMLS